MLTTHKEKKSPNYSKILLLAFIFLFSFFLKNNAKASTIASQLNFSTSTNFSSIGGSSNYYIQQLGNGISGTIQDLTIKGQATSSGNVTVRAWVFQCDNSVTDNSFCINQTNFMSQDLAWTTSTIQNYTYTPSTSTPLNASKYTYIMLTNTDTHYIDIYGTSNQNAYLSGDCYKTSGGTSLCPNTKDLYFVLNGASTGLQTGTSTFLYPQQSYIIPDFTNWVTSLQIPTSTQIYGTINYQNSNSWNYVSKIYTDYFSISDADGYISSLQIPKKYSLFNYYGNRSTTTQWIARLDLYTDSTYTTLLHEEEIKFTITPFTTSTQNLPYQYDAGKETFNPGSVQDQLSNVSSTDCQPAEDWTDVGGGIRYGLCSAVVILFNPQGGITDNLNETKEAFGQVFPFSVYFSLTNQLNDTISATTSTTQLNFPMLGLGPDIPILYPHVISSTLNYSVEQSWFNMWTMFIWLSVAYYATKLL